MGHVDLFLKIRLLLCFQCPNVVTEEDLIEIGIDNADNRATIILAISKV